MKFLQKIISLTISLVSAFLAVRVKNLKINKLITFPLLFILLLISGFFGVRTLSDEPLAFAAEAHTFDAKTQIAESSASSITGTLTIDSTATLVAFHITTTGGSRAGGAPSFSGETLTQAGTTVTSAEGSAEIWYKLAPITGTSRSITVPNTGTLNVQVVVSSYISSSGSTDYDTTGQTSGVSDTASITITPTADGAVIVDAMFSGDRDDTAVSTASLLYASDTGSESNASQYLLQTTQAGFAMGYTLTRSDDWAIVGASFIPSTSNTSPTTVLNTPTDTATISDTTPTLEFTGTDADSDDVEYNVQIDTVNTFDSSGSSAIVVDSTSSNVVNGYTGGPTTLLINHIVGSSADKLVVAVQIWQDVAGAGTVTSVTFESETFTKAASYRHTGTGMNTEIWYLDNPSIATGNISVLVTGAIDSLKTASISLENTATGFDTSASSGGGGTTASSPITPTADNSIIIDSLISFGGTTAVQSETSFFEDTTGSINAASQYVIQTTAVSNDMDWSWTTTGDSSHLAVSFPNQQGPLLDKVSTTDTGFSNTVTPADTHPFTSAEKADYDVQSGDALADDTYYWRVRSIDPLGTNTYGSWATTRSFTLSTGGGGSTVLTPQSIFIWD